MNKIVYSLFDGSGFMGYEWALSGCKVFCFNYSGADHGEYIYRKTHPNIIHVDCWIDETFLETVIKQNNIPNPDIIFAFPSCTNLAGSGAKHIRTQSQELESVINAQLVESLANQFNCPWMVENPVGKMSTLWRKPDYYFDPYEYGGYLLQNEGSYHPKMPMQNAYTKKTCIWSGNGFIIPEKKPVAHIGKFWGWAYLGGKSLKTKQLRSLTPEGFARAVFIVNRGAI